MTRLLGVDGCHGGWVALASDRRGYHARTIGELVERADADGRCEIVAVDIPIGLPVDSRRKADVAARALLKPKGMSVFMTPVREALAEPDYASANTVQKARTGLGLSAQAYALRQKILDVDGWLPAAERRVVEVHPEVCFATMAGGVLPWSKKTWAGALERHDLLAARGVIVPRDLGPAGMAGVDDVLDAAAALWTAARVQSGDAVCMPGEPELLGGIATAIWC